MKLIKFLALIISMLMLIQASGAIAADKKPLRIVRLPILYSPANKLDYDTAAGLEMKLARATIIPFNKNNEIAEYVNYKEASAELGKIWQKLHSQNQNVKLIDAIRLLADKYDADLVVCPIIGNYSESLTNVTSSVGDSQLSSNVDAELILYDRRTNEVIDEKASRIFNSSYNKYGTAAYLAGACFDELIQETNISKIFRNIGK